MDLPPRIGQIRRLDLFDAKAFNVHPKMANAMDTPHRIMMEVVYEAIVDAGL